MNNPKPKFNLQWYQNEDLYSEGDIEDLILQIIRENEPENYSEAIYSNYCWSTYYHLTPLRKNIINWYPFHSEAEVLEIGCGMGAVTGVLCDKCKSVTAVELSKRRATGTLWRCREKENLEIIVGNLNDIKFDKKFDYITLIGVLEYQGDYTNTENPYLDFLINIKKLLKPDGKLLIAIENQFGLKYWCGAREDHNGVPFSGINHYMFDDNNMRTFSKAALDKLIKASGFQNTYFYYPLPDYKVPFVIYSERYLPRNETLENMQCYYAPDNKTLIAHEENLYKDIIENQVFEFFANSFLVECTDTNDYGTITFACLNSERLPEYQIATRLYAKKQVEKMALSKEKGQNHIQQIMRNQEDLERRGLKVWKYRMLDGSIASDYTEAVLWEDVFLECCRHKEIERAYGMIDMLFDEIYKSSDEAPWEDNIMYQLMPDIKPDKEKYGPILQTGYLDLIFKNAFWIDGQVYWFDQEWLLENIPAKYIVYRALKDIYAYKAKEEINKMLPIQDVARRYGLQRDLIQDIEKLDDLFLKSVMDWKHLMASNGFRAVDYGIYVKNINKLLTI